MLIFIVLLYFVLACSLIGLAVFPAGRQAVWRSLAQMRRWSGRRMQWSGQGSGALRKVQRWPRAVLKFLLHHRWLALPGLLVLVIPSMVALTFGTGSSLPGYEA